MTAGSFRISSGVPSAILLPNQSHHTVAYPHDEVHVMFDEQDCHSPFI